MTTAAPLIAILAAGRASRFGGGKLDAMCAGKPLGRWVIDAVTDAGVAPGLLIVGPQPPAFAEAAMPNGWTCITNPHPEDGMGGSVALAAAHAQCLGAGALILLLADMPLAPAGILHPLLSRQPFDIPMAARYPSGRPGVPARFPASLFEALKQLDGDRGAATLLQGRDDLLLIDMPAGALMDVDDREGLARAQALLSTPPRLG